MQIKWKSTAYLSVPSTLSYTVLYSVNDDQSILLFYVSTGLIYIIIFLLPIVGNLIIAIRPLRLYSHDCVWVVLLWSLIICIVSYTWWLGIHFIGRFADIVQSVAAQLAVSNRRDRIGCGGHVYSDGAYMIESNLCVISNYMDCLYQRDIGHTIAVMIALPLSLHLPNHRHGVRIPVLTARRAILPCPATRRHRSSNSSLTKAAW